MPSDTFTLQIFDTGISIPALHATTHLTGGADAIPTAVASVAGVGGSAGLMSALQAQQLVTNNGKVTNADHDGDVSGATTLTIGAGKVTTAKILDLNVTTAKIAAAAVDQYKIADGNVTLAKLANVTGPVVLGRSDSSLGGVSAISCTTAGFALIGQPDVLSMRSYLGLTFPISVANGGTNLSSYAVGDLLYASGGTTLSKLPDVISGNVLLSGGVTTAPAYGKVALSGAVTHVTGVLPVANGGTGLATITGYLKGAGTTALATSPTIPVADISGVLPIANGGTGFASAARGDIYLESSTIVPVTVLDTYYVVPASGALDGSLNLNMVAGTTGSFSIKNTSGSTRVFVIHASVDVFTGHTSESVGLRLYSGIAGSTLSHVAGAEVRTISTSNATVATSLSLSKLVSLPNNGEVAIYLANHTNGANDITVQRANLTAVAS